MFITSTILGKMFSLDWKICDLFKSNQILTSNQSIKQANNGGGGKFLIFHKYYSKHFSPKYPFACLHFVNSPGARVYYSILCRSIILYMESVKHSITLILYAFQYNCIKAFSFEQILTNYTYIDWS